MPLSASKRAHVRQVTDKPFDAQAMPKPIGVAQTAGEVRLGTRTDAYRPAQPRAAPPPGLSLES